MDSMSLFSLKGKVSGCPFLRDISTDFGTSGSEAGVLENNAENASLGKGPIFSDESNFEVAFKLFHGEDGVVPLPNSNAGSLGQPSPAVSIPSSCPYAAAAASRLPSAGVESSFASSDAPQKEVEAGQNFSAVLAAAPLATIGLSGFGGAGPFGFDAFREGMEARKERQRREAEEKQQQQEKQRQKQEGKENSEVEKPHEAAGDDWLATGNCPIARSYRAFSRTIPVIAAAFKPPSGVKYICPPAIVAARAAVAKHPFMQKLRPQALPVRVLAIGAMGLFLNVPLGAWREHYEKFSPQWVLIVHASVPFVAILRKAALMPKYAMAFTIAASIIGQTIGSRIERKRVAKELLTSQSLGGAVEGTPSGGITVTQRRAKRRELGSGLKGLGFGCSETMVAYDFTSSPPRPTPPHSGVESSAKAPAMNSLQLPAAPLGAGPVGPNSGGVAMPMLAQPVSAVA